MLDGDADTYSQFVGNRSRLVCAVGVGEVTIVPPASTALISPDSAVTITESGIASYFRGLLSLASAQVEADGGHLVSGVVAAYYGVFHLGACAYLFAFRHHSPKRQKVIEAGWDGDPAAAVQHRWVRTWLEEMAKTYSGSVRLSRACSSLWDMRQFVHYAPRLRQGSTAYRFDTCAYSVDDLRRGLDTELADACVIVSSVYDFAAQYTAPGVDLTYCTNQRSRSRGSATEARA